MTLSGMQERQLQTLSCMQGTLRGRQGSRLAPVTAQVLTRLPLGTWLSTTSRSTSPRFDLGRLLHCSEGAGSAGRTCLLPLRPKAILQGQPPALLLQQAFSIVNELQVQPPTHQLQQACLIVLQVQPPSPQLQQAMMTELQVQPPSHLPQQAALFVLTVQSHQSQQAIWRS